MRFSFQELSILVIIFLINLTLPTLLQIFLSTRKNKWYGRVLPTIPFLISLLIPLQMIGMQDNFLMNLAMAFGGFLVFNIPTAIFIGIYFAGRKHVARKSELNQMKFQDLG